MLFIFGAMKIMKQSKDFDAICIGKILKYIQTINDAYSTLNIRSVDDLVGNAICQLAVTQAITNIYELRQKIQDETLVQMPLFVKLRLGLKAARNIASHDYDSLDFGAIYSITHRLFDQRVISELEAVKNDIEHGYTSD